MECAPRPLFFASCLATGKHQRRGVHLFPMRVYPRRLVPKVLSGQMVRDVEREHPGRKQDPGPPPKPGTEHTPFRSAVYVSSRNSADGNSYAVNEPVPEIEWNRQVEEGIIEDFPEPVKARPICPKCNGTGKRGRGGRNYANHKFNCACVACIPCKDCNGVGRIEVA